MRARCGGGAAAWVAGVLAAPGTQGVGGYGSRKYSALEGYGNQYWPIHSNILAWRTPLAEEPSSLHSTESQRVGHDGNDPTCIDIRLLFTLQQLCPSEG